MKRTYTRFSKKLIVTCLLVILGAVPKVQAQAQFAYFGLEPDIVTNYLGSSARKLGYVRLGVELLLASPEHLEAAEHHAPLLRATVIEIFGRQTESNVKSLTGREQIRRDCLEAINELMQQETGADIVKDVIFTKYLYQG